MDKHFVFKTQGVCASEISFDYIDGHIWNVVFDGGCRGNTQGVAILAEGMKAQDVVSKLTGVLCSGNTSCPDQLAKAVKLCMEECGA